MTAKEYKTFLLFLTEATPLQQAFLIKSASEHQIRALREVVVNTLRKRIPLETHEIAQLRQHQNFYLEFSTHPVLNLTAHTQALLDILGVVKATIVEL